MITPTFILLLVVASTNAHNWLNSLSRSTGANTRKPAAPSKTGQPHAQVAAGQFLQAEWVQGVAEKDYNQLNKHTDEKLLNAYLSEAGATKGVPSRMHSKYHRVYSTGTPSRNHGSRNNYFTGFVPRTAAHFIERDRMFSGRFTGAPRGRGNDLDPKNVHQAIYPNDCTKTDRYSAHKSSKYAWILSVWKFRICIHNPNRPDVAGFQIPPGTPPGKYFLHWKWRGYYDIIDVQVVTGAPVANPYGAKLAPGATPPPAAWKRIEHCEFLKPQKTYGCLALKDGESEEQCLKDCARSAFKDCNGVNVVTVHNPTSVYPAFRDMVNIPFGAQCPKQTLEVNPPNSRRRACYSLITREDSDLPDEQELIATEDPDEPAFYSTCWKRLPPVSFDMPPAADEYRPPTFMFGHKCISCDQAFANLNTAKPQYWDIKTEDCENCALRPMPTAPPLAQVLMGTRISGIHLVRTPSDVRSQPIQPGEKIPLPNTDVAFVIRCDFTPGAVKIVVDPPSGANVERTEMKVPFASHGDNNGNYPGMAPQKGKWRVTATVDNNKPGTIEFEFV